MASNVNIEYLSDKLRQKRTELLADLARRREAARGGETEVGDDTDAAESSEDSAVAMQEISLESGTLQEVEDALKRMEAGTYGNCIVCGKPIPNARLDAIPWTQYDVGHAPN